MTLETFFEKFELFAELPDATATIRGLVLQLAVQGRLAPQNEGDEDAESLIATICQERQERAAEMRIPGELDAMAENDKPFQIPARWEWTQLGNIALQIQYGYTASADPIATDVRMLRITDIQNNRVDWPSVPGCQIQPGEAERYLLRPNDILIARTGGTIGKSFIVPETPVKSVFASYLIRVTPPKAIEAKYLKVALESPLYWEQLRAMSAGTGQPNVNGQALGRLLVPIPPRAEQKRIVDRVEELMSLCDTLDAHRQHREASQVELARASLARFAEAQLMPASKPSRYTNHTMSHPPVLTQIHPQTLPFKVKARAPKDPNDEPAHRTLPKLAGMALDSDDDIYPPHWLRVPLGKVGEWRGGGTPSKSRPDYWEGTIPWVSPKDMKVLRISDAQDHISEAAVEGSAVRKIPAGSLLMVVRGMILARAFPVAITTRSVTINQDMKALTPFEAETADFLLLALRALEPQVLAAIERSTHGTCKLQTDVLEAFPIPFPPLAEQRRIVAKVDALIEQVDQLQVEIETAYKSAPALLEAVVLELTI